MGSMVAQQDQKSGEEHAVYYLSKKLLEYETRYTPLEKTCTAFVWTTKRLRHYMIAHQIRLISRMDLIKYLFEKPALTGRMARVDSQLPEDSFPYEDLEYVEEEDSEDWWQLYFDGAANQRGYEVGILLISPVDLYLPSAFWLDFSCTNNIAEYEACAIGLKATMALEIKKLRVYGDSSIVICQTQGKWKTKDEKLKPYQEQLESLIKSFDEITFEYLPRDNKIFVDALATLASMVECTLDT
ncbi:uncharacterized protein LOC122662901 [Telopea speciosissima]|uniref:uncharacterized protein LOC122662901 n=1 Tax=Telopea speciosissima TaxID=54955 RepID=UPI001CC74505|nr:uncharacterized protein LOC122662901 [Telopea speciosissima]